MSKNNSDVLPQPEFTIEPSIFQKGREEQKKVMDISKQVSKTKINNMNQSFVIGLYKFCLQVYSSEYSYLFGAMLENNKSGIQNFFKDYIPVDEQFVLEMKNNINKLNIVKLGDNKIYIGEFINKKCFGKAIIILKNGSLYEGEILDNRRHGKGTYIHINLGWYKGYFQDDLKHGQGLQILYNKSVYKGQFVNGLKHDEGVYIDSQGNIYEGSWKLGIMHGKGILKTTKSSYNGNFANWLKHGSGQQHFVNGDIYRGEYQNGRFDGIGTYQWKSQDAIYEGYFKNGMRHGKGKWQRGQTKYNGSYIQGLKEGYGQLYFPSGNFYKGSYVKDKNEGYGQMFWTDGSFYKGVWKNGVQNGKGEVYIAGGDILSGIFENSIMVQSMLSLSEKEMQISHISIYELLSQQKNHYQQMRPRTLSDTMGFVKRRKLRRINQSVVRRDRKARDTLYNGLYYRVQKSPEKSQLSGEGCQLCNRRNESFRVKQKNKKMLNNSCLVGERCRNNFL